MNIELFLLFISWLIFNINGNNDDSPNPEIFEAKNEELQKALTYDTGYEDNILIESENASLKELQKNINQVYNQIKCAYMFNAQTYLIAMEELLRNDSELFHVQNNVTDVAYDEEAFVMIRTLFNVQKVSLCELWLFFTYTHTVKTYIQTISSNNYQRYRVIKTDVMDMHKFVSEKLKLFTDSCNQENKFNISSKRCKKMANKLIETQNENNEDKRVNYFLSLIALNKKELNIFVGLNLLKGLSSEIGGTFNYDDLFMLNTTADVFILVAGGQEPMYLMSTWNYLNNAKKKAMGLSLKGVKSLGTYQRGFLDLLKVILLQITWKYLLEIKKLHIIDVIKKSYVHITEFQTYLIDISNLLGLSQDIIIETLIKGFDQNIFVAFEKNVDNIIDIIKNELKLISEKLEFKIEDPLNTLYTIDVFLRHLKYSFKSNLIFRIIKSFNKITESLP